MHASAKRGDAERSGIPGGSWIFGGAAYQNDIRLTRMADALYVPCAVASDDATVVVNKKSSLAVSLPSGAVPQAHLGTVQNSVCAGKPAGCTVSIASSSRRLEEEADGQGRRLESTQITFEISIPAGAADSLGANATEAAALTSALTGSLASALGPISYF